MLTRDQGGEGTKNQGRPKPNTNKGVCEYAQLHFSVCPLFDCLRQEGVSQAVTQTTWVGLCDQRPRCTFVVGTCKMKVLLATARTMSILCLTGSLKTQGVGFITIANQKTCPLSPLCSKLAKITDPYMNRSIVDQLLKGREKPHL